MSAGTMRARWAALGAAVAVALGAGGFGIVSATISSGSKSAFVPITPCRLVDTRKSTAIGAAQTVTYQVRGVNGECNIPAGATAVSGNATITDPTDDGFLTLAPAGGIPNASNLNWLRGQSPTPNAFTVALSADGRIDVRNDRGTVNLIIDINGYYEDHNHDDRYYTKVQTDTALATKANAGDVYSKSQIDDSVMNSLVAAGTVNASGLPWPNFSRFGSFTSTKYGLGSYGVTVPGLNPSCNPPYGMIIASQAMGNGTASGMLGSINCVTGDTTFYLVTYNGAGASVDWGFSFAVYADRPTGGLTPVAAGGPSQCTFAPDGEMACE